MKLGAPVPSPCTKVCVLDPKSGYCCGCLRTVDEIAAWPDFSDEEKLALLARLEERRRTAA